LGYYKGAQTKNGAITTALTADWQKLRRFALQLLPADYAER
jgi:hypothetical protein